MSLFVLGLIVVLMTLLQPVDVVTYVSRDIEAMDRDSMEKTMECVNEGRRKFAKTFQISNMHELKYDEELSRQASRLMDNCYMDRELEKIHFADFQVILVSMRDPVESNTWDEVTRFAAAYLNNPTQTLMGFATTSEMKTECRRSANLGYSHIFLLGPHNDYIVRHGRPATACARRESIVDGLCANRIMFF